MANIARNILEAHGKRKQDFISFFSGQTTNTDNIIAGAFAENEVDFGSTLVTFIRLSLNHLADNTESVKQQLATIFQGQNALTNNFFDTNPPISPNPFNSIDSTPGLNTPYNSTQQTTP